MRYTSQGLPIPEDRRVVTASEIKRAIEKDGLREGGTSGRRKTVRLREGETVVCGGKRGRRHKYSIISSRSS